MATNIDGMEMAYKRGNGTLKANDSGFDSDAERESVKASLKKRAGLNRILGKSRTIESLHDKITQIAACDVSLLISGESGVGKELVARAVHYASKRAGKPFIPVNCGAVPENLFENELFGHVKGAFTDACLMQTGLVQEAEGGTLFLDEVGMIPPFSQVKLLRLLQESEYRALGDSKSRQADIRIIAATNSDLRASVRDGSFREDLYYRLNIVSVHIPPLREREGDIALLIDHFLEKYAVKYGRPSIQISPGAMKKLAAYSWPGNVRELENKIQQLVVMSGSAVINIDDIHLPFDADSSPAREPRSFNEAKRIAIESFEKKYLLNILSEYDGDVASAARGIGKNRTALWNLIRKYNLSPDKYR